MDKNEILLYNKLLDKSKESFILGIEIYNKPTIKYRIEGFSFFICNAWELMLKAHLLQLEGSKSIYYKDNPSRTINLENCIKFIFTNEKAPLRLNLEKIIELRNTSTHFITEEYEMVYIPLFQACIFNFSEKMHEFHNLDITNVIPNNFLTLMVNMNSFNETEIRAKYPEEIVNKLIDTQSSINSLIGENNSGFAIKIEHYHYITKNKDEATSLVKIDNSSENNVKIIKELKNPNLTHKYTMKKLNQEITNKLQKLGITISFNQYHFHLFCTYYDIKSNEKFCFINTIGEIPTYSYSIQTADFIVNEIIKDTNIIENLKIKLKNKLTPGTKDS
jgi:Protein of unknown function (DUF3644).